MKNTHLIIIGLSILLGISILTSSLLGYQCWKIAKENNAILDRVAIIQDLSKINADLFAVNHPIEKQFLTDRSDLTKNDGERNKLGS